MIDLPALSTVIEARARVARVVIAGHRGSTPRETGAAMLVWEDGASGSIGGGRLELEAETRARAMLADGPATEVRRQALGPALGQCCGGAVVLVTEVWDAGRYRAEIDGADWPFQGIFARRVEGAADLPARLHKKLVQAGEGSQQIATQLTDGWLIEQVWQDRQPVFIYGAGHVGHALACTLAQFPQFEVAVVDVRPDLDRDLPDHVLRFFDRVPHEVMAGAPPEAAHLIMTPEHDYDLELCHHLLQQPFTYAGLIGSASKWARFRGRLKALGHADAQIDRIECPIGDPSLGKQPQAIAIGVAARLVKDQKARTAQGDNA